jgi:hypothetical protein
MEEKEEAVARRTSPPFPVVNRPHFLPLRLGIFPSSFSAPDFFFFLEPTEPNPPQKEPPRPSPPPTTRRSYAKSFYGAEESEALLGAKNGRYMKNLGL